ncbi:MAG: hypothetical protein SU899_03265 [Chloroflexota bacterium]|nr:hypothetical protein [Chloroflexota bacterium]
MAKHGTNKPPRVRSPKKGLPWFLWLAIVLGIVAIVAIVRTFPTTEPAGSNSSERLKAAIVDQLYSLQPNETYIGRMTQQLRDYGFEVDIYQGDVVTVDLYRELPGHGYKLIIFRTHAGLLDSKGQTIKRTCLFTNELYNETKHVTEQLTDQLAKARIDENHSWVFGIGDKFIARSMEGEFDNTVIIMMGCSCLHLEDLAQAFIDKGASAYLGWNATVDLNYVDEATPYLVEQLCGEKAAIRNAVRSTMVEIGPDPKYGAVLKYYPLQTGDTTLEQLIYNVS